MASSRCTSSRDLNEAVEFGQLKKTSASSSRESSPQDDNSSPPTRIDEKTNTNMPPYMSDKAIRSRSNSVCIQMPESPSFRISAETATLIEAGAFVTPKCGQNTTPLPDSKAHKSFNFGTVIPGVYRSSYPQEHNYSFLKTLGLKTVVTLVRKEMPPAFHPFLAAEGIVHHVFDMRGTKKESIPLGTMRGILAVILDRRRHPVLIHCNHGKHRTGCVVGVVRKLSGWHLSSIHNEYKAYAEPKSRDADLDYIAGFNTAQLPNMFSRPAMVRAPITLRSRPRYRVILVALILAVLVVHYFCLQRPTTSNVFRGNVQ